MSLLKASFLLFLFLFYLNCYNMLLENIISSKSPLSMNLAIDCSRGGYDVNCESTLSYIHSQLSGCFESFVVKRICDDRSSNLKCIIVVSVEYV